MDLYNTEIVAASARVAVQKPYYKAKVEVGTSGKSGELLGMNADPRKVAYRPA